jgi:hypothetical protein
MFRVALGTTRFYSIDIRCREDGFFPEGETDHLLHSNSNAKIRNMWNFIFTLPYAIKL